MTGIKSGKKILCALMLIALTACSTKAVKEDAVTMPQAPKAPALPEDTGALAGPSPPLTLTKNGKKLNLVRIMDGGACKNEFQGAKGTFLLYANPDDIERIKREKGAQIFGDFEEKIQTLSTESLQQAIYESNLAEDPFALGDDEAQEKLARQLASNFRNAIGKAIDAFEKETTLTIDINAFVPSFIFYQKGCEAIHPDENIEPDE